MQRQGAMLCVTVSAEMVEEATQIGELRFAAGLYNRFLATDELRRERAFIGVLGEVAFEALLTSRGIAFESDIRTTLEPDRGDFFLPKRGQTVVDVKIAKTTRQPRAEWRFGVPVDQHPEDKDVIVIGWWNPNTPGEVCYYGSIEGRALKGRPPMKLNAYSGAQYLTENMELLWGELDPTFGHLPGMADADRRV